MDKKEKIFHRVMFALMIIGMVSCLVVSPTLLAFGIIKQIRDMFMYSSIFALGGALFVAGYGIVNGSIWSVVLVLFMYMYGMGVGIYGVRF